jgi:hypothetical protein
MVAASAKQAFLVNPKFHKRKISTPCSFLFGGPKGISFDQTQDKLTCVTDVRVGENALFRHF